jgi:TRAP-type transport system small permease protein
MNVVKSIARFFSTVAARVGMVAIFLLLVMTVGDVLGRYIFNHPIPGTFELTKIFFAISVFFSFSVSQYNGENLGITLLYDKFPLLVRGILDLFSSVVSIAMFTIAFLGMLKYASRMEVANTVTSVLRLPMHPWIYVASVGLIFLVATLIWDFAKSIKEIKGEEIGEP